MTTLTRRIAIVAAAVLPFAIFTGPASADPVTIETETSHRCMVDVLDDPNCTVESDVTSVRILFDDSTPLGLIGCISILTGCP